MIKTLLKEAPYAMFLRKVDRAFPDAVLKEIMDTDFGHTHSLLHNQAQQKKKVLLPTNNLSIIGLILVACFLGLFLFL
jgi:hypothetical protein